MFRKKKKETPQLMVKDLMDDLEKGDRSEQVIKEHAENMKKTARKRTNTGFARTAFDRADWGGTFGTINTGFGGTASMSW